MTNTQSDEVIAVSLTHAMLRNELSGLAAALAGGPMTPGQEAVLEGHIRLVTDHLRRHHEEEQEFLWPRLASRAPQAAPVLGALRGGRVELDALVEKVRNRTLPRPERAASMARTVELARAQLDEEDRSVLPLLALHVTPAEQRTAAERTRAKIPLAEELRVLAMMLAAADPAERARILALRPDSVVGFLTDREAPALCRVHQVLDEVSAGSTPPATGQTGPLHLDRPGLLGRIGVRTQAWLRDLMYCLAVCVWSVAAFTLVVSGASVTLCLLPLVIGVIAWVGFVHVTRCATSIDRALAGWRRHQEVRSVYRRPPAPGFISHLKTLTSDPQSWKDLGWLALAPFAGFTLGLAVVTAAGMALAFITMPAWYWAVSDPQHQYGVTNLGLLTVDTFRDALAASGIGLAMVPVVLLMAHGIATLYSALAVRILAAHAPDPVD